MAFTSTLAIAATMLGNTVPGYNARVVPPTEGSGLVATEWTIANLPANYQPLTFKGAWDKTSGAQIFQFGQLTSPASTTVSVAKGVATTPYRVCLARGISCPLATQIISGTVNLSAIVNESNADADLFWYVHLYVTAGNTDDVRGVLLDNYQESAAPLEWIPPATQRGLEFPQVLTPVAVQNGDRLAIELGYISRAANDRTGTMDIGATSTVEFSRAILEAGLIAFVGAFNRPSLDTGLQVIVTNFRPKAVLFYVADGTGASGPLVSSIGFTDGVRSACRSAAAEDNVAASDNSSGDTRAAVIWIHDRTELTEARAVLSSFNDDGFTLNWLKNSITASVTQIVAVVLGGESVEAKVGYVTGPIGTGTPQTLDVNDVGWTPSALIVLGSRLTAGVTNQILAAGEVASIGFATTVPAANAYAACGELTASNPTQAYRRQIINKSLYVPEIVASGTLGDARLEGAVTSDVPGGFQVSWTTVLAGEIGYQPHYLALRGVRATVLVFSAPTTEDAAFQSLSTPFAPKIALFASAGIISSAATDRSRGALALSVTPEEVGMWVGLNDAVTPTQVHRLTFNGCIATYFPAAGSPTLTSLATVSAVTRTLSSGYTLNWTTRDTFSREVIGLVLGDDADTAATVPDASGGGTPTGGGNPGAEASLAGQVVPLAFATIQTDSGEKRYGMATISAPSSYQVPGWIEGRILQISPIRRSLSDWQGRFETGSCTMTLSDYDRVLRGLANSGVLLNKRVDIYLASEAQITAGTTPRRVFQGIIRQYRPLPDLQFDLQLEDFLGAKISQFNQAKLLPATTLDVTTFPNLPPTIVGKPEPLCYGLCSDESLGAFAEGVVPATFVGRRLVNNAWWDEYLICRGAIKKIQSWFGRVTLDRRTDTTGRGRIPSNTEGVDFLIPGHKGWTTQTGSAALYRTFNGKRYTVFYARGPHSESAKAGTVPLAVNVQGYESVGDGTGTLIDSLPLQILHLLTNFVLQTATGNWLAIPTVGSPAYAQINSDSFTTVDTTAKTRVSGGYKGAFVLGWDLQAVTLADVLALACLNGDFSLGVDRSGRIMASMEDSSVAVTKTFTDLLHVLEGSFSVHHAIESQLFNSITYRHSRRYVPAVTAVIGKPGDSLPPTPRPVLTDWLSGELSSSDATSIANLGETRTFDLAFGLVRDAATAANVVSRRLARLKNGPIYPTVAVNLEGTDVELGQNLGLVHYAGMKAGGYVGTEKFRVLAQVVDLNPNPSGLRTVFEVQDISAL